jgi:hypothetical protein
MPIIGANVVIESITDEWEKGLRSVLQNFRRGITPKKNHPTPKMSDTSKHHFGEIEHSASKDRRRAKNKVATRSRRINRHR